MEEKDPLVPVNGVVPVNQQFGDDERDTLLLKAMASEAGSFLEALFWCKRILNAYFSNGIGGIVAVFLFQIEPLVTDVDEWLWVIVGDIPPAYLVIDDSPLSSLALYGYIEEMSKWIPISSWSTLLASNNPPSIIYEACSKKRFQIVTCREQLAELRTASRYLHPAKAINPINLGSC